MENSIWDGIRLVMALLVFIVMGFVSLLSLKGIFFGDGGLVVVMFGYIGGVLFSLFGVFVGFMGFCVLYDFIRRML